MNLIKTLYIVILIIFGIFMFVYGELDDSPGGQLLGLLAVVAGIIVVIKKQKKAWKTKITLFNKKQN